MSPLADSVPVVSLKHIVKEFHGNRVLNDVSFDLHGGEVHALVGCNGSGKSTLMKIIYGVHRPSDGTMYIRGSQVRFKNPGQALRFGISNVPQELPLVKDLTVAENIFFGNLPRRSGVVSWKKLQRIADEILCQIGVEDLIDSRQKVGELELGAQQIVSIARSLAFGAEILVFDEPTSSLDADGVERLFSVINRLKRENKAVAFISQRLDDIFNIADRVSVLRDGEIVGNCSVSDISPGKIAELMVGHEIVSAQVVSASNDSENMLLVDDLCIDTRLNGISFTLHKGEVLGLVGLPGSGVGEILPAILGRKHPTSGRICFCDKDFSRVSMKHKVREGIAYISGDRAKEGLVKGQTVGFNLLLALNNRCHLTPLSQEKQKRKIVEMIETLDVHPANPDVLVAQLSGGNQQKVVVGRWLLAGARLWLLDDPTRGVDIHSRTAIHALIKEHIAIDGAVVMTSSDIREMLDVCDRLLVVYRGRIISELDPRSTSEHRVVALMSGDALSVGPNDTGNLIQDNNLAQTQHQLPIYHSHENGR